ncbi:MAG: glycosyltransferase [Bacteroidetes bacterium]|jgi:glycosyltransferase involved in cell wall biosynthesis|nr:glycosyltransferase [Bacteroidota bacterium]
MNQHALSILIPVYNYDVRQLVGALQQQAAALHGVEVEILCFDDASQAAFRRLNAAVGEWAGVEYRLLPNNLGRSRIRNLLAREARHDYLLFIDCDSQVPDEKYLQRYVAALSPNCLLYGGRIYQPQPPADKSLMLHWKYGSVREARPAEERQKQAYHSFMTNNFLIPRALFQPIGFDERLLQYGHEDTLFGMALQARGVRILHLDNPLVHAGLESSATFMRKSRQALENLAFLHHQGTGIDTRLLRWALRIHGRPSEMVLRTFWEGARKGLERQLCSARPSLRLFDLYRLGCLLEEL